MSKIQAELVDLFEIKQKRGESRADFLAALMVACAEASDKDWDSLSKPAQDWYNKVADAKNEGEKVIADFPDVEKEEEQEAPTRRRGAAADKEKEERLTKKGDVATVLTKRGKSVTGKVVAISAEEIVIVDKDGEEHDFDMSRVESVTVNHGDAGKDEGGQGEAKAYEPKKKDVVTITNKRGKVFTGKIVELEDDLIVLDVDGKDEEIDRDRIESIVLAGEKEQAKEKEQEAAPSRRRGAAADSKEKDDKGAEEGKRTRTSNEGVSIGQRIKEIIAEDLDISEADLVKQLKKEGLDFKENTVNLNYKDCMKFVAVLRAAKLLK